MTRHLHETVAPPSIAEGPLDALAGWSFLLFVAALPWAIAPMSIAAGLCGACTLLLWVRRPGLLPATPVAWPSLAWLLALVLAAWFAVDRAGSLPRITKAFFPLLVPLAATHARLPGRARRALAVLLVSSALASLYGWVLYLARGAAWPARARGAAGHYMTFGGQLLIFVSVAAGIAALARARRWRWAAAATALLGCATLLPTYTRSAWIGLSVSLGVLCGLTRPRWILALVSILLLALVLAPPSYRARALSSFDPHHPTNVERTYMWQAGIAMFRDHPLTGVGLEDLRAVYDRYKLPQARERAGHLHNVPIQIAASMGLAGLIAWALLYTSLFAAATRGLRRTLAAGGIAAGLRAGVTGLLAGFLLAGLFEWNFGDEELLYPLFTLVGMAWAARSWDPEGPGGGTSPAAPETPAGRNAG
jgi:O-antigen ligase